MLLTEAGNESTIAAFVGEALRGASAECRIKITQFQKAYDSLAEGLKKQGLSGSQITTILWARLMANCPQCGWHITGEDLGKLWLMGCWGFDRAVVAGPGRATRFGRGSCPNENCSSSEVALVWEARPADDLNPIPAMEGDAAALKIYWQNSAREWWKGQARGEAVCDKCTATIPLEEGYYSPAVYSDLVCERCCDRRLSPDRLDALYCEKASGPRQELREARRLAGLDRGTKE
jgi:hypothetical protein